MNILAIETSCDETSVAVVEDGTTIHSLVVNSQIDLHKAFGGVVPEVAARSHIEVMLPVVQQALEEALYVNTKSEAPNTKPFDTAQGKQIRNSNEQSSKLSTTNYQLPTNLWDQIDAIAVTQGPGLLGSLLIGTLTARTLAWSLNKPLIPVHHILGHVYANWITQFPGKTVVTNTKSEAPNTKPFDTAQGKQIRNSNEQSSKLSTTNYQLPTNEPTFPVLALIVSGGHTQLMLGVSHTEWRVIGRTRDDAVGEAFDKVAKVLGLPYPGGISVSKAAEDGDAKKYPLPTPQVDTPYDFSFSGLKTAVLRAVQQECGKSHDFPSFELAALLSESQKRDFAASFESTAIRYLVKKTAAAYQEFQPKTVIIGGGVAASLPLRRALSAALPIEIGYAPQILCTDNAAMIGARAYFQSQTEPPVDPRDLEVKPSWPL